MMSEQYLGAWVRSAVQRWAGLSLALFTVSCGGESGEFVPEPVAESEDAVIVDTDYLDGSGTIRVRVKKCDPTAKAAVNCAYCVVDSGWSRVGGGAEIIGESGSAQLKASYPGDDAFPANCTGTGGRFGEFESTWMARSVGVAHTLRAYVIGIQIKDASGNWIAPAVGQGIDRVTGHLAPPANTTVQTREDEVVHDLLVGGGAEVVPDDENGLLNGSRPLNSPRAWQASDRLQQASSPGGLKSYGIGLTACPPAWNGDCFTYPSIRSVSVADASGYGTATFTRPASWVMTSLGGASPTTSGGGRYLNDLIPFNGSNTGFTVRSRSGTTAGTGTTQGYAILIGRTGSPYLFNAVRFNFNGTALSRPTGANPRLQQSTAFPDAAPLRFHLQRVSDGVYRLRNGNPDSGTECAYRETGTTVRVTTCGDGNEFKWTLFSGNTGSGTFQLRNVAAGQCLDSNGQGFVTGNVVLKNCVVGGSTAQGLFLDAFNLPPP